MTAPVAERATTDPQVHTLVAEVLAVALMDHAAAATATGPATVPLPALADALADALAEHPDLLRRLAAS